MTGPIEQRATSYLSHKAFKECKRLWLYRYAPEHVVFGEALWEVIRQGRLLPVNAMLGRVVDDVITASLRFRKRNNHWPSKPTSAVLRVVDDYLAFSRQWTEAVSSGAKWPRKTGKQAVDRLYFGETFEPSEIQSLITNGEDLVVRWFNLPLVSQLDKLDMKFWRVPESGVTPHFMLEDINVYAKFDFMTVGPDRVRIYDWKTGNVQRGEDSARIQLHGYAAYAIRGLGVPLEQIDLISVWLGANFESVEKVNVELLSSLEQQWRSQVEQVSSSLVRLRDRSSNVDAEFPMTDDPWLCRNCVFRSCERNPKHRSTL